MIARIWRGRALPEKADAYQHHFETEVAANLKKLPGNLGAQLLRRADGDEIEFTAITLWDSMGTIEGFAGADLDAAHIEPAGRAALSSYDDFVTHHEVVHTLSR